MSAATPQNVRQLHHDLYEYKIGGDQDRLLRWSFGSRVKRPDARRYPELPVLGVRTGSGVTEIVSIEGPGKQPKVLRRAKPKQRLDMPRWAHRGDVFAYVDRHEGSYRTPHYDP